MRRLWAVTGRLSFTANARRLFERETSPYSSRTRNVFRLLVKTADDGEGNAPNQDILSGGALVRRVRSAPCLYSISTSRVNFVKAQTTQATRSIQLSFAQADDKKNKLARSSSMFQRPVRRGRAIDVSEYDSISPTSSNLKEKVQTNFGRTKFWCIHSYYRILSKGGFQKHLEVSGSKGRRGGGREEDLCCCFVAVAAVYQWPRRGSKQNASIDFKYCSFDMIRPTSVQ